MQSITISADDCRARLGLEILPQRQTSSLPLPVSTAALIDREAGREPVGKLPVELWFDESGECIRIVSARRYGGAGCRLETPVGLPPARLSFDVAMALLEGSEGLEVASCYARFGYGWRRLTTDEEYEDGEQASFQAAEPHEVGAEWGPIWADWRNHTTLRNVPQSVSCPHCEDGYVCNPCNSPTFIGDCDDWKLGK